MTTDPKPLEPCPHCGEYLVRCEDHHGAWFAHKDYPKSDCAHGVTQLFDDRDEKNWNRRAVDREMVEKIYLMTKGHIVGWYGDETIEQIIEALEKEK